MSHLNLRWPLVRSVVFAAAISLLSMSAYLLASRLLRWPAHRLDYFALVGCALLGSLALVAASTIPVGSRVLSAVLLASIVGVLLFFFMFAFVGVVFGDYL